MSKRCAAKLNVLERQGRTREYLALWCEGRASICLCAEAMRTRPYAEAISYGLKHLMLPMSLCYWRKGLRESGQLDGAIKSANAA